MIPASKIFTCASVEPSEHLVEVAARLVDWQTAQPVVAAELHDHDGGMQAQHERQTRQRILCGCAARALIDDFVAVALRIQPLLQKVGIGLAVGEAIARR